MATKDENSWQAEKSLTECIRYIFENEILTDICIEVGPPGGDTSTFRAHKCILVSRSEVFEGMFSSGMTECRKDAEAKVRIEDLDADVFKEVLNYMYCESPSVSPEMAPYLMYAAKKYMLPKLVKQCRECLLKSLDVNNAIHLLEQSLLIDEKQLTDDCLQLISLNATSIFTGADITTVPRQVLEAILDMETVDVSESIVYKTAVKWAKHQHQSANAGECPTDLQIRDALGDLLYKIRFPVMKPTEFAAISTGNNILTAEEKESIYYFLVTKTGNSQLKFPTESRISEEVFVDRALSCVHTLWHSTPYLDAINFVADHNILLTGIGLYPGYYDKGYNVDVQVLHSASCLFTNTFTIPYTGDSAPCKLLLDVPIGIPAGDMCTVKALSYDSIGHYAYSCQAVCTKEPVTFTFSKHPDSPSTSEVGGQIPRLYYRCM